MANAGYLTVSDKCYWVRWEIESYVTDKNGNYVDKHNHLIDCIKYLLQQINWKMVEKVDKDLIPDHQQSSSPDIAIDPEDWADNIVTNSLEISRHDFDDYF